MMQLHCSMAHDPLSTRLHWQQEVFGSSIIIIILLPVLISVMESHTLAPANTPVYVKILAVNDFHGQRGGERICQWRPG